MGLCTDMTDTQWQSGLRALQGLNLALLIATEHQGFIGRRQIQPDDVPGFLFEVRVIGQLEGACEVRFYVVGGPYPLDAGRWPVKCRRLEPYCDSSSEADRYAAE